jgi:hypothetical protein
MCRRKRRIRGTCSCPSTVSFTNALSRSHCGAPAANFLNFLNNRVREKLTATPCEFLLTSCSHQCNAITDLETSHVYRIDDRYVPRCCRHMAWLFHWTSALAFSLDNRRWHLVRFKRPLHDLSMMTAASTDAKSSVTCRGLPSRPPHPPLANFGNAWRGGHAIACVDFGASHFSFTCSR